MLRPCCAYLLALRNAFSASRQLHTYQRNIVETYAILSIFCMSAQMSESGDTPIFKCDQDDKAWGRSLIQCSSGNRTSLVRSIIIGVNLRHHHFDL